MDRCFADLGSGKRVALDIKDLGSGKFDVVLANGKSFSGNAIYMLNYGSDFSASGNIGFTDSKENGKLFYFDWAPVQWDECSKHTGRADRSSPRCPGRKTGRRISRIGFVSHGKARELRKQDRLVRNERRGLEILFHTQVPPGQCRGKRYPADTVLPKSDALPMKQTARNPREHLVN